MSTDKQQPDRSAEQRDAAAAKSASAAPAWSDGLRKLYDSVVEEPLPDSFKDLLSKLDDSSANGST
jgi:hypothetical protein